MARTTNSPQVFSGIVAPSTPPTKVGDIYVDTVAAKVYIATNTNVTADWKIMN